MRAATLTAATLTAVLLSAGATAAQDAGLDWRISLREPGRVSAYAVAEPVAGVTRVVIAGRIAQPRRVPGATTRAFYTGSTLAFEVDCPGRRLRLVEADYVNIRHETVGTGEGTDWMAFAEGDQGLAVATARTACPGGALPEVALADADLSAARLWLDQLLATTP